jgi:hypothetical protein
MAQWTNTRRSDRPPGIRRHTALACVLASVIVLFLPIAQRSAVAAGTPGPTAAIQPSPSTGDAPLVVNFNGAQSYGSYDTIASWDVSFGDGTTDASGTGSPPATIGHTYTTPGSYTAGLTVTDGTSSTASATTVVTVTAPGTPIGGQAGAVHISVTGGPLKTVVTSPVKLTPRFRAADTDYVWYCANGTNSLTLTLSSSRTIMAGGQTGTSVSVSTSVVNNQAVVLDVGAVSYWIRCLPSTFPHTSTTRTGTAIPGYYVTGTFKDSSHGVPGYPIILDRYGTPVWYQTGLPFSGDNVEVLPGTHTVAWSNQGPYSLYSLDTQGVTWVAPPMPPPDEHELFTDAGGNQWMISAPVRTPYDLSAIGYQTNNNIVDCVVQELNAQGLPIWSWDASQHVSPLEANTLSYLTTDQGLPAVDLYHCNSVDVDPENPDLVLISMRESGVFLVDKASGSIKWKMGGTSVAPMDHEPVLTIAGDPEGAIQGQHDVRFQPNGEISMFDDHTGLVGAARAIDYLIDTTSGTATMTWESAAPSGKRTSRMGSVRTYDSTGTTYDLAGASYLAPVETLIDWGQGVPVAGFTVVDNSGTSLMNVQFQAGYVGNRTEFVPLSALDLTELHDTAGTPFP